MPQFDSKIDLGLPESPILIKDSHIYQELVLIYNALRKLQDALQEEVDRHKTYEEL